MNPGFLFVLFSVVVVVVGFFFFIFLFLFLFLVAKITFNISCEPVLDSCSNRVAEVGTFSERLRRRTRNLFIQPHRFLAMLAVDINCVVLNARMCTHVQNHARIVYTRPNTQQTLRKWSNRKSCYLNIQSVY